MLTAITTPERKVMHPEVQHHRRSPDLFNGAHAQVFDFAPAPGWTAHTSKDGRIFYCNHVTRTASWLPPVDAWRCGDGGLPYGWERAVDDSGKHYYINHVNKTTTYETPVVQTCDQVIAPEPRNVTLERSPTLGFGFVAGSEKPVIVRFVTEGGPSVSKLLPGDQILFVNKEDVKLAPREHVISLVRACTSTVSLVVCQPHEPRGERKSTLLSASKRAQLKSRPSRVRFAESVCVNGAPLFPPSAFSLGDTCVPPMANVLKVFLENGQTKSFKYDALTTVHDVVSSLEKKLCIKASEHFSLVVEHIKSLKRNKLTLLDPSDKLVWIATRPGAHKLRCLFRIAFVPTSAADLAQRDLAALDYLYIQCCNDVTLERFAPELQYETALRLAALHIYQHALANNIPSAKLTVKTIEKEFGLERFVPSSLLDSMKRKEVRKVIAHFLKLHTSLPGSGKQLTILQAKLIYLDIVGQLPSYGAKCFSVASKGDATERVLLVSPKFGISQITGYRNSVPVPLANIDDMTCVKVYGEDEVNHTVFISLKNDHTIAVCLEERDANELVLVLSGNYRLVATDSLPVDQQERQQVPIEDLAPPYLAQHKVIPERWSYINQQQMQQVTFVAQPAYQPCKGKTNGLYNTLGRQNKPPFMSGFSLDSNMNTSMSNRNHQQSALLQNKRNSYDVHCAHNELMEARNEEVLKRMQEMKILVESSEKYLSENAKCEWQESSVDLESDTESMLSSMEAAQPGKLKHSDSLLLLTHGTKQPPSTPLGGVENAAQSICNGFSLDLLRSESVQSESDNDSIYTPNASPKHNSKDNARVSFGLHSPDSNKSDINLNKYLEQLISNGANVEENGLANVTSWYDFDPDIIDLTFLPPPDTPDDLGTALPTPINMPPRSFSDSVERLNKEGVDTSMLTSDLDLEEFLASVTVPPPTKQVTPAIELTPEEIMSYIIPPPPKQQCSDSDADASPVVEQPRVKPEVPPRIRSSSASNVQSTIEYATVERRGPFSCCSKAKSKSDEGGGGDVSIRPPPRKSPDEKPPERPPKTVNSSSAAVEYQRSQSLPSTERAPMLPPRGENANQAPPHLFLPPKKPPLPPVPSLETLRARKAAASACVPQKPHEARTAGIGSPHLQRSKNMYTDIDNTADGKLNVKNTAVSTPTSPHLGRGAYLTAVPIQSPGSPKTQHYRTLSHDPSTMCRTRDDAATQNATTDSDKNNVRNKMYEDVENGGGGGGGFQQRNANGCASTRTNLLAKTDSAMGNLLMRLDQVAAQCNAAQLHGGGYLMCEEKFQVAKDELTSQSLQLVTSSKMLVIAMSDPCLPDLPENLAICLTILRRLTELSQDLTNHTTAPLQTRNLVLKVHDVIAAFRHLITSEVDRTSQATIEEHLANQAERLANVLATLLRSLRVFSP